jgi:hypothetical protein
VPKVPKWLPFSRFFRKGDKISPEMQQAIALSTIQNETGKGDPDADWKQELGTNYEILHDQDVERMLNEEVYDKILYQDPDDLDEVTKEPKWKVGKGYLNTNMAALRMSLSHTMACAFITQKKANILEIKQRAMFKRIKLQTRPDLYDLGMVNLLKACEIRGIVQLQNSIEGRMAKLLKTIPRVSQIEVRSNAMQGNPNQ